ncbi:hypothetical protein [Streptomyces sp. NRRL F-2799]|uniref:hypothetical protein n=1 Tax=Streptomyces sp. NRRL F-2799 TaxID=1463844 RepID=UPI0004C5FACC|nr:hypothetical protein [Streptomyces sp. NRRL F-2799]
MRRTVRALSAAALAGATLVIAGPASAESGAPCEDPAASAPKSPGKSYDAPLPGAPYLSAAPTGPARGTKDCAEGSADKTGKTGQAGDDPAWEHGDEDGQGWDSGPAKDDPPTVEHGVQAGAGGTFTDSVPALTAGGALIAAAAAGAGYRLYGRRRPAGR